MRNQSLVARLRIEGVEFARGAHRVELHGRVMDDSRVARKELPRLHVASLAARDGQDEVPVHVVARCAQRVHARLQNQIGFAQLPAPAPARTRWQKRRVAFDGAAIDPSSDGGDLRVAQTTVADEFAMTRFGRPGRHGPPLDGGERFEPRDP